MTEREVSSERVSEERLEEIIAGCEGVQSNLMPFIKQLSGLSTLSDRYLQRLDTATVKAMAELALLSLRSSVKTVGEFTLDEEELDTILAVGRNEQSGRITNYELKELVRVYRAALEAPTPQEAPSEVTDTMVQKAWEAYDTKSGYSKPERFRAALTAALKGGK